MVKFTLWTFDEHRIRLLPISRGMWVPKGSHPTRPVVTRYRWPYLNGFVNPEEGNTFWLTLPTVSLEVFSQVLLEFADFQKIDENNQVILVLDGAGFHNEKGLSVPKGVHLVFLPPYSPELQPAEKLWPLSNEGIANEYFPTLDELEEKQCQRCQKLREMKEKIKNTCLFNWWPRLNPERKEIH